MFHKSIYAHNLVFLLTKTLYYGNIKKKSWNLDAEILCTYWLSGRAGRENIWLKVMAVRNERSEVRTEWPRAKYFSIRPDLTQSISILSYDKIRIFCFKQRPSRYVRLFERAGRLFTARSQNAYRPVQRKTVPEVLKVLTEAEVSTFKTEGTVFLCTDRPKSVNKLCIFF